MKSRALILITMTLFAALAITASMDAQEQKIEKPQQYTFTDLGTLGGPTSTANGINNKGWVTGVSDLPGGTTFHGFLWQKGVMTDLGTLGGPNSAVLWPVKDNRGLIVGVSDTSNTDPLGEDFCGFGTHLICLGFLWQKGAMTPLPTLGGNNGYATGVNNRGQVVGLTESTRDSSCTAPQVFDWEAVVWGPEEGEIHELPPFPGDSVAAAIAINDKGQVVGGSGPSCGPVSTTLSLHAVLWQDGSVTDLGSFGGTMNNVGTAINNLGQVVGFSDLAGDTAEHAFLWQDGRITDLGTLPGDFSSAAFGINNKGQVVGNSCNKTGTICRAFFWQDGVMTDLNTLIPAGSPVLIYGGDTNSGGEIVGQAFDQTTGKMSAFLLTPSNDEAASGSATTAAQAKNQSPKVTLPESVRNLLQQRRGFGRFRPGPMRLQ